MDSGVISPINTVQDVRKWLKGFDTEKEDAISTMENIVKVDGIQDLLFHFFRTMDLTKDEDKRIYKNLFWMYVRNFELRNYFRKNLARKERWRPEDLFCLTNGKEKVLPEDLFCLNYTFDECRTLIMDNNNCTGKIDYMKFMAYRVLDKSSSLIEKTKAKKFLETNPKTKEKYAEKKWWCIGGIGVGVCATVIGAIGLAIATGGISVPFMAPLMAGASAAFKIGWGAVYVAIGAGTTVQAIVKLNRLTLAWENTRQAVGNLCKRVFGTRTHEQTREQNHNRESLETPLLVNSENLQPEQPVPQPEVQAQQPEQLTMAERMQLATDEATQRQEQQAQQNQRQSGTLTQPLI